MGDRFKARRRRWRRYLKLKNIANHMNREGRGKAEVRNKNGTSTFTLTTEEVVNALVEAWREEIDRHSDGKALGVFGKEP